jgi:hypothetical protein
MPTPVIVTHHAPDLDAIGAVWLLKKFYAQEYAAARVEFVDPGDRLSARRMDQLGLTDEDVIHVDTGLGEFDHHQPERGHQHICATSLVYENLICQVHPERKTDKALQAISDIVTDIDHFGELFWPESSHNRYAFMVHEILHGLEQEQYHDDDSLLQFGMTCLSGVYRNLSTKLKAEDIIAEDGISFEISTGKALAVETGNDDVLKLGQRQGFTLVFRKDSKTGHVRIKARPDTDLDLKAMHNYVREHDPDADWFYHASGKMLLNSSSKSSGDTASSLSLVKVMEVLQELYPAGE